MVMHEKQLKWRCRRGVRELDVLFDRFLQDHHANLSDENKTAFEQLLDVQDPVIMDWLFDRSRPDAQNLENIIEVLQSISK